MESKSFLNGQWYNGLHVDILHFIQEVTFIKLEKIFCLKFFFQPSLEGIKDDAEEMRYVSFIYISMAYNWSKVKRKNATRIWEKIWGKINKKKRYETIRMTALKLEKLILTQIPCWYCCNVTWDTWKKLLLSSECW